LAGEDTIKCLRGLAGPGKSADLRLTTWKSTKDYYFLNNELSAVDWLRSVAEKSLTLEIELSSKTMFRLLLISREAPAECSEITKTEHLPGRVPFGKHYENRASATTDRMN
jgi:hypothetical protein